MPDVEEQESSLGSTGLHVPHIDALLRGLGTTESGRVIPIRCSAEFSGGCVAPPSDLHSCCSLCSSADLFPLIAIRRLFPLWCSQRALRM